MGMHRLAWLAPLALVACSDLDGFTGTWRGQPLASPTVRVGLAADTEATLELSSITRTRIQGTLTVGGPASPLRPLASISADALGELSLPDGPLRSYFTAVALAEGDALALVSLYDERVDVRLIRGDALYAVLRLHR
jgi:hypothetical protein